MNVLMPVFRLQEQKLHYDEVGAHVVNRTIQEDNAVFEEQIADRHLPLTHIIAGPLIERSCQRRIRVEHDGPSIDGWKPGLPRPPMAAQTRNSSLNSRYSSRNLLSTFFDRRRRR